MADKKPDSNPGQADYDKKVDLQNLSKSESAGNATAPQEDAETGEENPDFVSNVTSNNATNKTPFKFNLKSLREKGPIATIITIVATAIVGGGAFFGGPSLLLVQVAQEFTGTARLNTQLTSFTTRTDSVLASKFAADPTSGLCTGTVVKFMCKYTRPSNRLLKQMEKYGIEAYKGDTKVLSNGPFPSAKPDRLVFKGQNISANEFLKTMATNPEFRAAARSAYNPRFISLADKIFSAVKARFGISGKDKEKGVAADKVGTTLDEAAAGVDTTGAAAAAKEGDSALTALMKKLVGEEMTKMLEKIASFGKAGDAEGLVAGIVCAVGDVPGVIVKVVKAYQETQFIKYAMVFAVVGGAIMAGDASQEETSGLGSILTTTVGGNSAMDSFGMRNALNGDTAAGSDTKWQSYVAGASVLAALGTAAVVLNDPLKKNLCAIATSPAAGVATEAALGAGTFGIGTVVTVVLAAGVGFALGAAAPTIISEAQKIIPDSVYHDAMQSMVGDLTKGATGMPAGDILAGGYESLMSQTSHQRQNQALSIPNAIAYNQLTKKVDVAFAQDDRITHSPLDATNPNTALGSFVNQFLPYYSDMGSVSGIASMLGGLLPNTFSSILSSKVSAAGDPATQFNQCPDPQVIDSGVAATPLCAVQYGVPTDYLGTQPVKVVSDLMASGDIDSDGNVLDPPSSVIDTASSAVFGLAPNSDTSSLKKWMEYCADDTSNVLIDCQIKNQKTAEYAMFNIDHSVQQTMDGEDSTPYGNAAATPTSASVVTPKTNLFAALDSFMQPQIAMPTIIPTVVKPVVATAKTPEIIKLLTIVGASRRYVGVTA